MKQDLTGVPTAAEARASLMEKWQFEPKVERVALADCKGRVVAEDLTSVNSIPKCRVSAMDGYAVKSAAFAGGLPDTSKWERGVDFVNADTGDDFPDEFDTVIPVERLNFNSEGVLEFVPDFEFKAGTGIRPAASLIKEGDLLAAKGDVITTALQVNLATGGQVTIPVVSKPKVAFIPTGNELTPIGMEPLRGQNLETNGMFVKETLEELGADITVFPIIRDVPELLEAALNEALEFADIVLINGGSSKGSEDFNTKMLRERGSYFSHLVRCVPGKPTGISIIDDKPVINVPGPTLACWTVIDWLVKPMVCKWLGCEVPERQTVKATLTAPIKDSEQIEHYSRVHVTRNGEKYAAEPFGRDKTNSQLLREGNGLVISPVGETGFDAGEEVEVQLL